MEQGLGSQDAQGSLGPLELTLARQGESGGGGLFLVEHHLPSQAGKVYRGEESGLFFLDVGQRLTALSALSHWPMNLAGMMVVEDARKSTLRCANNELSIGAIENSCWVPAL